MDASKDGSLIVPEEAAPFRTEVSGGEVVAYRAAAPGRAECEDAAAIVESAAGILLLVADGMGGQPAGARASQLAIEEVARRVRAEVGGGGELRHALLDGIEAANEAVRALGVGAGTTLAAMAVHADGHARPVHVGDSVVLHVGQRGRVKAKTVPHSLTGLLVEAGTLDEADALVHEDSHVVTNYVGQEGMRIEVGTANRIATRDTLVVASDGLADNLTLEEIVELVRSGPLLAAGEVLAELARVRMERPQPEEPSKPDDLTFLLYRRAGAAR
ncbi:MAG: protein phosphatase 2C domain-containing protein [Myxococcota bacterium]